MTKVLFSTNCYKKDFRYLSEGGFEEKILLNNYPFAEKWIVLNEVEDKFPNADAVWNRNIQKSVLKHFDLDKNTFIDAETGFDGYIYSIDSLIELAFGGEFDYICHFCGDVELYKKADWITEGIQKIEEGYVAARPRLPRYSDSPPAEQELTETDIFSDHVYLIHRETILKALQQIFTLTTPPCEDIHPIYGGESFERKMTRYLKHTKQKIAIIQNAEEIPSPI